MSALSRTRTLPAVVIGFVLAAAVLLLPATPAHASVLDVTCTGGETATYNPALTSTPQTVTTTRVISYSPCVSTDPAVTSGARNLTYTAPGFSCVDLLGSGTISATITWNTGQTSTVTGNRVSTVVGATTVTVITGTVTAGLFTGDTVVQTQIGAATPILTCNLGLGTVSGLTSTIVLEISST
ncbi:hypothetical protein [Embleya sp. NPDC020630]|uniref:hypothetical protein n=1 Tax=Embleya sp. NPDC020630 TaxID=3363979 RepID=UPI0037919113